MVKILYICNFESPYRVEFWNDLAASFDVTVLFSETKEQQRDRNKKWFSDQRYKFTAYMLKQTKVAGKWHICFDVTKFLKDRHYELVIFHPYSPLTCMYGILYCIRHKIPYIINSDGGFVKSGRGFREKLKKYLISHAEAFTSTGKFTDDYLAFYGGNRATMYHYTLTSVRRENIQKALVTDCEKVSLRKKLGIQEANVVVTVGHITSAKGIDLLLEAAKLFDNEIGIYIIGGKPPEVYLQYCKDHSLNRVHFMDFMKQEELRDYYRAADIFILPTRHDVWGLVVVEAMASGLPVITTDRCIAGMELIIPGENGYIYPVNDPEALAQLVNQFFAVPCLKEKMSRAALHSIQGMSIESMAKRHTEIFKEVLNKRMEAHG